MRTPRPHRLSGLSCMVLAAFFFAIMSSSVYEALRYETRVDSLTASFIRVVINGAFVGIYGTKLYGWRGLMGDFRISLWLRGVFGAFSLIATFYAVASIGVAYSSFLHCTNTLFIALLSPFLLDQKISARQWLLIIVGLMGVYLLMEPDVYGEEILGRVVGLSAGLFSALAYLMVARSGISNRSSTVVFYFCFVAVLIHLMAFTVYPPHFPEHTWTWLMLLLSGVSATVAQHFMTVAYQRARATDVSIVAYTSPVFALIFSVVLFGMVPDVIGLVGASLIIISGIMTLKFGSRRAA